jgi:DNA-binding transcriptional LysR family regulator
MPSILNDSVELRHLLYFRAVAEAGGFTRAAAEIGLTQPTLSQQIAQMERELGVELISRRNRECLLTPAGELVLQYARRIIGDMEALRRSLDDMSGLRRGSLSIAVLPVLAQRILPLALARFHKMHPGIRVLVNEMSVDEMARALSMGTVEVGLGCLGTSLGLKGELLYSEELVAVLSKGDSLAARPTLTVAELAQRPVIAPPAGFGMRSLILQAWAKARRPAIFALEVGSVEAVLKAVASGAGPGILPGSALWGIKPDGWTVRRIMRPTMKRQIGFITAQGGKPRPAASALLPLIREAVREMETSV